MSHVWCGSSATVFTHKDTASIYNIRYIKPLDTALIDRICRTHSTIITVEDGTIIGGLHGAVAEYVTEHHPTVRVIPVGIPDRYISQGTQKELREECCLTTRQIRDIIDKEREKD